MLNSCNAPENKLSSDKPEYSESPIRKSVEWFRSTFGVSSDVNLQKAATLDDLDTRETYARHLAEMGAINPEEFNRMSSWLAAKFNQVGAMLGADPTTLSQEGQLRLNMLDVRRVASGLVTNVTRFHQVQALKKITEASKEILAQYGIKGNAANDLFNEVVEYGHIPDKSLAYDSDIARRFNTLRYETWKGELLNKTKMSEGDFNSLVSQSYEYASIVRNVRDAAKQLGVDVGDLDGIGYFTRVMTDDFKMRYGELDTDPKAYDELMAGHKLFATVFNKTRETMHYAPAAAIDVLAASISKVKKETVTPESITTLIDSPTKWREFLESVPVNVLDSMVETGVLQQIPMTSKEVFEFFTKKYELPYKGLNEMFHTNPEAAIQEYTKSLGQAAANSRVFSYVSTRGIEEGWTLTKGLVEGGNFPEGTTKADWVKLGDIDWQGIGIDPQTIKNREAVYLHTNAAEQLKAVMYVAGNPAIMSNLASGIAKVSSLFRLTVLAKESYKYVSRILVGNMLQTLHATGLDPRSVPLYFNSMVDVTRAAAGKAGLDFLDDTKGVIRIGDKSYTKRAAFQELATYRYGEYIPLSPGDAIDASSSKAEWASKVFSLYSPRTLQSAMSFAAASTKPGEGAFKYSKQLGKYYGSALKTSLGAWFAPFATFANMSDVGARWAILQMKEGQFNSWQEAFKYMDDYLYTPDATGTFGKSYGSLVQPFASYALWNPPAAIRHALREPAKFMAYHKLVSFTNRNASKPCSNSPEAAFQPWMLEGAPLLVGCDGKNPLVMQAGSFDNQRDAFSYLNETGETVTGLLGGFSGTSEEQRKEALHDGVSSFMRTQLGNSYWKGAISAAMNQDIETGREYKDDIVTWNGIEMSPRVRSLLTSFPIPGLPAPIVTFDDFNKLNPGNIFGRKAQQDSMGNVIRPEQLSIFGTRRTDVDTKSDDTVSRNQVLSLLRAFGLSINVARVAENIQSSEGRIDTDLAALKKEVARQTNQYLDMRDKLPEGERQKRYDSIDEMAQKAALVEVDLLRVRQYMLQNNIPSGQIFDKYKEAVRKSAQVNMMSGGIPMPNIEGQTKIVNDYYKQVQQLNKKEN